MTGTETLNNIINDLDIKREDIKKKHDNLFLEHLVTPGIVILFMFLMRMPLSVLVLFAVGLYMLSYLGYRAGIKRPFKELKNQLKATILKEFMSTFHPEIECTYSPTQRSVREITRTSKLVSADKFHEEDVIEGKYGNTEFYISEVKMKKEDDDLSKTVFDGILFKIKVPGTDFPHTRILSKVSMLSKLFRGYKKHEDYGFYYDSSDDAVLFSEFESLFPFIKYLIERQDDLRISVKGDEIVLFMKSEMNLFDDPEISLHKSFKNTDYNENLACQMNSLLFIVEAFSKGLSSNEKEDYLELSSLKMAEKVVM